MSTVYDYILTTGVIVPDAATIQTGVQQEYIDAFGSDLNVTSPSTPQGLLINAETQARIAVATNNSNLANQINPNFAGGVSLDALLALMGAQRAPASSSVVSCTLGGASGTIIPVGAQAQDHNGNLWQCLNTVTIPLSGSLSNVSFQAVETGAILVASGTLTTIVSNVLGWNTITNPDENTVVGQDTQSDVSARQYRINTLYLQSNGLAGSIISALIATQGVNSLFFLENPSTATTIEGVAMAANSIYVCVDGGTNTAVAATLTATKSAGCAYTNGASVTSIVVTGTLGTGSNQVTGISSTVGINVGMSVSGTGIPTYTTVTEVVSGTIVNLSANATVSSAESLTFTNNITVPYLVPISSQIINVSFDRPDLIPIGIEVTVTIITPVQDYVTTVINAILNYAAGGVNGLQGFSVGSSVSPFEISASIGIQYPGIYVSNLLITTITANDYQPVTLTFDPWQLATIIAGNISVSLT